MKRPSPGHAAPRLRTPADLAARIRGSQEVARAWRSLTPAARRMASTWIGGAKRTEVRAWRIADVLRRADRYQRGAGPFYPSACDQALLSRPRAEGGR